MDNHATHLIEAVRLADLADDPYPIYRNLRRNKPVCWVPAAGRYFVTRHADIAHIERHPEIFSADETLSLMKRVMGHSMLRKDGAAHKRERNACEPALRPGIIRSHWMPVFSKIVDDLIDSFVEHGKGELFKDFAAPCASRALAALLGLTTTEPENLATWSQAMMDGTGNYADDPDVWRRSEEATASIDAVLEEVIPYLTKNPDRSIISAMIHAADPLNREEISANVKVIIGGGLNEPRDAILTGAVGLMKNPAQLKLAELDPTLWRSVFEETVRWVAPIGMYPRQTTCEAELGGVLLPAGARLGVLPGSGNRDETVFDDPDTFDISREKKPHVAFGGGAHFCLGTWAARVQVGEVALPTLFRRLKGLRLVEEDPPQWAGWVFRGPTRVPVRWAN
jgi:cytochrome P450